MPPAFDSVFSKMKEGTHCGQKDHFLPHRIIERKAQTEEDLRTRCGLHGCLESVSCCHSTIVSVVTVGL
jgi:hypothetical protein